MAGYIPRNLENTILKDLEHFPAVALLGPRQCGKSTLALNLRKKIEKFVYLDLESFEDLQTLEDPELFFRANRDALICLDEIQNKPNLFPVLRSILDRNRRNGQLIILGSASRDLIKQSSETLAGRISFLELTIAMAGLESCSSVLPVACNSDSITGAKNLDGSSFSSFISITLLLWFFTRLLKTKNILIYPIIILIK